MTLPGASTSLWEVSLGCKFPAFCFFEISTFQAHECSSLNNIVAAIHGGTSVHIAKDLGKSFNNRLERDPRFALSADLDKWLGLL